MPKGFIEVTSVGGLSRLIAVSNISEVSELPPHTKSTTAIQVFRGETVYCIEHYDEIKSMMWDAYNVMSEVQ